MTEVSGGAGGAGVGAMTRAMRAVLPPPSGERWVRVGIARRGTIVGARWVRPGTTLTWGRSERADVVVRGGPAEPRALVAWRDGRFELCVEAGIAGRLALRAPSRSHGASIDLAEQARAGARTLALEDGARARVELEGTTVLLELAPRPPEPRRAPLPVALGRSPGIDGPFSALALASLVAHAVFVVALSEHDWPAQGARALLEATIVYEEPLLPPDVRQDDASEDSTVADADEGTPSDVHDGEDTARAPSLPRDRGHAARPRAERGDAEPRLAELDADAIASDVQLRLGALMPAHGRLDDLVRGGALGASEADVMGQVAATAHAALEPRPGAIPGERRGGSIADLQRCSDCGAHAVAVGPRQEGSAPVIERPPAQVSLPATEIDPDDPTAFDVRVLARALRGRMGAVRACYERALRDQPDLAGRLELELQVERSGALSGVRARAGSVGDGAFHGCVVRAVESVRISPAPDGAVRVAFPFVLAPQS